MIMMTTMTVSITAPPAAPPAIAPVVLEAVSLQPHSPSVLDSGVDGELVVRTAVGTCGGV